MFGKNLHGVFGVFSEKPEGYSDVSPQEAISALNDGGSLALDVRSEQEFLGELGHVRGAMLMPVAELPARIGEIVDYKDKKIFIFCRSGHRSRAAASALVREGFAKIYNVTSGMIGVNQIPNAPVVRRGA